MREEVEVISRSGAARSPSDRAIRGTFTARVECMPTTPLCQGAALCQRLMPEGHGAAARQAPWQARTASLTLSLRQRRLQVCVGSLEAFVYV